MERGYSAESRNETVLTRARGWWPNRHWNPGADRWTWINGAIGDTARKAVKTKVSRLDGSRYTCRCSRRRRTSSWIGWWMGYVRSLTERRIQRHVRVRSRVTNALGRRNVRMHRVSGKILLLSPTLTWQTCAIKTPWRTIRSGISALQTNFVETSVSSIFLYLFAAPDGFTLRRMA